MGYTELTDYKKSFRSAPNTDYCIHALNAVYLAEFNKWIRLDARGNKEGVNAQFSIDQEQLAYLVRTYYDEYLKW